MKNYVVSRLFAVPPNYSDESGQWGTTTRNIQNSFVNHYYMSTVSVTMAIDFIISAVECSIRFDGLNLKTLLSIINKDYDKIFANIWSRLSIKRLPPGAKYIDLSIITFSSPYSCLPTMNSNQTMQVSQTRWKMGEGVQCALWRGGGGGGGSNRKRRNKTKCHRFFSVIHHRSSCHHCY